MVLKTTATALLFAFAPIASFAGGCFGEEHQVQSCETGYVWDVEVQGCVQQATS